MKKAVLLVIIILLTAFVGYFLIPKAYNPFSPFSWEDNTTFATKFKLSKLKSEANACKALLTESTLKYEFLADRETGESCGFYNTAVLKQSGISYGGGITLTCPALVSLVLWEQRHLQEVANKHFGQDVVKIRHFGTYACRNINGSSVGRRSEHAFANAIDIAGFELADGAKVSILNDYAKDTAQGKFLYEVRDSACQYFKVVLGPEYNDLHKDHFHFDMGSSLVCK